MTHLSGSARRGHCASNSDNSEVVVVGGNSSGEGRTNNETVSCTFGGYRYHETSRGINRTGKREVAAYRQGIDLLLQNITSVRG